MTKNFAPLQRYWQEWEAPLNTIVKMGGAGAKLHFPLAFKTVSENRGLAVVKPVTPICIYNALRKGSSNKRGESHRLVIIIDGTFTLRAEVTSPCMVGASCNILFLAKAHQDEDTLKLKLIDALHFDIEDTDNSTAFHPIFHAQRGPTRITVKDCQELLNEVTQGEFASIEVDLFDEHHVLANPYLRLPTPQLDLFAVVTMVAADYFCNPKEKTESTGGIERFRSVLELLAHDKNLVRQGHSAMHLKDRFWRAENICVAHWYPEITGP